MHPAWPIEKTTRNREYMKTTNAKSRQFVESLKPFKANNLSARIEEFPIRCYVVYSYDWYPLFVYDYETNRWFENGERYSVSTSKQKSQCGPITHRTILSHQETKDLIQGKLKK